MSDGVGGGETASRAAPPPPSVTYCIVTSRKYQVKLLPTSTHGSGCNFAPGLICLYTLWAFKIQILLTRASLIINANSYHTYSIQIISSYTYYLVKGWIKLLCNISNKITNYSLIVSLIRKTNITVWYLSWFLIKIGFWNYILLYCSLRFNSLPFYT